MKKLCILLLCFILGVSVLSGCSKKNEKVEGDTSFNYPKKELRIMVPAGAAGNMSVNAQIIAKYLEKEIGKPVVVENKPGAGGIIGATSYLIEKANSDKIIILPSLVRVVAPLYHSLEYKEDDFESIIGMTNAESVVLANPKKTGINNLDDLIKYAENRTVKFGSGGPGAYNYMTQAALYKMAGISAETVPHKSAGEGITNLLGGHIDVTLASATLAKEYVMDGSLKPLFVMSEQPYTEYEGIEVPSIKDLGYDVTFDAYVYFAARKGTDQEIINYLHDKIKAVYDNKEFQDEMNKRNVTIVDDNGEEVEEHLKKSAKTAKEFYDLIEENKGNE
jgi:tripartite-type tricarboxylate transporter receptor subunit TctC